MQRFSQNRNIKKTSHTGLPHDMLFAKCSLKKKLKKKVTF